MAGGSGARGSARRGNAGVPRSLLHPNCSTGQPHGSSAFYFRGLMQCVRLNLFNLAGSLSFLIRKENCFIFSLPLRAVKAAPQLISAGVQGSTFYLYFGKDE